MENDLDLDAIAHFVSQLQPSPRDHFVKSVNAWRDGLITLADASLAIGAGMTDEYLHHHPEQRQAYYK